MFSAACIAQLQRQPWQVYRQNKLTKMMLGNTSPQLKVPWWRVRICCPDMLLVTKQHVWLVRPHAASVSIFQSLIRRPQRPFCLMMTRTTVITTILPDHREAGMTACGPWHGSVRHKCGIYGFLICHCSIHRCQATSHVALWQTCEDLRIHSVAGFVRVCSIL